MKNTLVIFFGLTLLFTLGGCRSDQITSYGLPLIIVPAITRVDGLNFEANDQVGLTITRPSGIYANNVPMTYDGAYFTASELVWYDAQDAASLVAYYPYRDSGMPTQFEVASDQSQGYDSSDLLVAVKSNVAPTNSAVGMVFRHMMARVVVSTTNNTSSPVTQVSIGGTVTMADVECAMQRVTVKTSATPTTIVAYAQTDGAIYHAIVVPQNASLTLTVKTADGKSRSTSFASNTLLQEKSYAVNLIVEKDRLIPTLTGEITDWAPGGELLPDGGSDGEGPNQGSMLCQGRSYKTVTLGQLEWMDENLKYIPSIRSDVGGVFYPGDVNELASVEEFGMLYDITSARSLCPAGWRLPTEADFNALIESLKGVQSDFIPMAGVYIGTLGTYVKFRQVGYLIGQTPSEELDKYTCMFITKGLPPQLVLNYPGDNGISVRFVKDI